MTGEYTKVPLRPDERWTGARMQQGRVLLEHEWNLNLDAGARAARAAAADAIGPAGVVDGTPDFEVGVTPSGPLDLTVHRGRIWVDGLPAHAPADFTYTGQDQVAALPASGRALVYLDVFEEHLQPAEAAAELVDPALAPIDTAARTRVGYRVRVEQTTAGTCKDAWDGFARVAGSTGLVSVDRVAPSGGTDPCAPPGDPLGRLPDGLFRVEVLDGGAASAARFAWSFENGGAAVPVESFAGTEVTLRPSASVRFATGDRLEVSWLARRQDRVAHGALYVVSQPPQTGPGGEILTLDRPVAAPAGAQGVVVRRWDGDVVGASSARTATLRGDDLGVRFTAGAGAYVPGDWWGARLREELAPGIEQRTTAAPDGTRHVFAPLALVDLSARTVLHDCRPTFLPLTAIRPGGGTCTVTAAPGDDLQAALDSIPAGGGELCVAAGLYELSTPLVLKGRLRIVIHGAGPASVVRAVGREAAIVVEGCEEIQLRHLRIEGGSPGDAGDAQLNGAVTVVGSTGVSVSECTLACPGSATGRAQTCLTARSSATPTRDPDLIRVEGSRFEVGPWETGILLVDVRRALVAGNTVSLAPGTPAAVTGAAEPVVRGVRVLIEGALSATPTPSTKQVAVPGTSSLNVLIGSDAEKLVEALAARVPPSLGARRGPAKAVDAVARQVVEPAFFAALPKAAQAVVGKVREELAVAWQGIVVGGTRAGTVQILDNLVEDTVQGIHVGVSDPSKGGREAAEEVVVARNVVHALVPRLYDRDRHGVFVGNARSVHLLDTTATLRRLAKTKLPPTPVEGIRIHGELGPFVTVRQTSLRGFQVGVRVVPLGVVPAPRLWLVAETMALGAPTGAALLAPTTVDRQRNVP